MSRYTTEVRYICERAAGLELSEDYNSVAKIISAAVPKVFSFDFPIFDEAYRPGLCAKILRHYYTREICEETVGLWKLRLETRMCEIMPYFNQLYLSEKLKFEPLNDTDVKTTRETTGNTTTKETGEAATTATRGTDDVTTDTNKTTGTSKRDTTTTERDLYSDTPQGALTGVESEEYLTNARKLTGTTGETGSTTQDDTRAIDRAVTETATTDESTSRSGTVDATEDYAEHVIGKSGGVSYSKLLQEFRETFLNIDKQVISALEDLFMGIW